MVTCVHVYCLARPLIGWPHCYYHRYSVTCIHPLLMLGLFRAAVPSGASTGVYEALEMRDKDPTAYLGKGK